MTKDLNWEWNPWPESGREGTWASFLLLLCDRATMPWIMLDWFSPSVFEISGRISGNSSLAKNHWNCPSQRRSFSLSTKHCCQLNKISWPVRLVPFSETAKRPQDHDIHFQNFMLLETLILLHFLEGENSQHEFTTGQMKIRESQRQRGACNHSPTLLPLGTWCFLSLGRGDWLQHRSS